MAEAQALWLKGAGLGARAMSSEEVHGADMRAGTVVTTGRDLDIAMTGASLYLDDEPIVVDGDVIPEDMRSERMRRP